MHREAVKEEDLETDLQLNIKLCVADMLNLTGYFFTCQQVK